ncbi:MAG: MFS transporter [Akkermansia sp.]
MDEEQYTAKEPTKKEWFGFWSLIFIQVQNAFNEKAVQFLLIPLAAWLYLQSGEGFSSLEYPLGAIIVIPYILFSPLVGWLSDCFCKARIIQFMAFLQIGVMACMWYCFDKHNIYWSLFWFCIFAIQATILSPARKGIVKDMVGSKYLGFASGIVEMSVIFSLLIAQIGVFIWFDHLLASSGDGWHAASYPTIIFGLLAIPVAIVALFLPRYPVNKTKNRPFSISLFYEHFMQLKYLWTHRALRLSEIGISYFWFLAGVLMLITIQVAKDSTNGGGGGFGMAAAWLMIWLSGGVIIGGLAASIICRKKNELGLIPLGALGVTFGCVFLSCFEPQSLCSNIGFSITGAFAAAYLVPLNAYLQDNCDPSARGNVIAAGNLMDMMMGLFAVGVQMAMKELVSVQTQFLLLSITSLGITVIALRLIPREFIRMLGLWIMSTIYRARVINRDKIPECGGVLLVSNHVTYGDALFLSMASSRPIRFIVAEEFVSIRWLGWLLELFNCLPISSKHPREALSKAIQSLKDGEVICIFPEGQLSRTGTLCAMRRGVETIARKAKCKILPIYLDELWGSILSYKNNRFFCKMPHQFPYHFTAAVGDPLVGDNVATNNIMNTLRQLSASSLSISAQVGKDHLLHNLESIGNARFLTYGNQFMTGSELVACLIDGKKPEGNKGFAPWINILLNCYADSESLRGLWINAQQIQRINALQEKECLLTSVGHGEVHETVVSVLWPILTKTPVYLLDEDQVSLPESITQMSGSLYLRRLLYGLVPSHRIPFYDFSGSPDLALPNTAWKPCFSTREGIVIAMSMCHSVFKLDDGTVQLGMRSRTRGRLMPGFYTNADNPSIIEGPALERPFALPPQIYLDESGFLVELQPDEQPS